MLGSRSGGLQSERTLVGEAVWMALRDEASDIETPEGAAAIIKIDLRFR